jgi:hypothetical protein
MGDDDSRVPCLAREDSYGKGPFDRFDPTVKGKLPQDEIARSRFLGDDAGCSQNAEGNREIKAGALFLDVSRRQVDGNAIVREAVDGVGYGGFDPLRALFVRCLRKPDRGKLGRPEAMSTSTSTR